VAINNATSSSGTANAGMICMTWHIWEYKINKKDKW
jgi:hypothetical protein